MTKQRRPDPDLQLTVCVFQCKIGFRFTFLESSRRDALKEFVHVHSEYIEKVYCRRKNI